MKNLDIQKFQEALMTITSDKENKYQIDNFNRFKYAVIRNIKKLEPIIEGFQSVVELPENYKQYESELYTAQQTNDNEKIKTVVEKWKDTVESVNEYNIKFTEFMNEDFTEQIEFVKIKVEDIPGKIPTKFYYFIDPMIKDE